MLLYALMLMENQTYRFKTQFLKKKKISQ